MQMRGNVRTRLSSRFTRRLMHLLGLVAVLPLVAVDPALVALLFDAEFLALLGTAGFALLRGEARVLWLEVRDSQFITDIRVAARHARERPRSLMEC